MSARWIIGIDEAGRGPLAGPVFVGSVLVPYDFDFSLVQGVRDSKKLTASARDMWYEKIISLEKEGLRYAVAHSSAAVIDAHGITRAVYRGIASCLNRFEVNPRECEVRLDGLLRAPKQFLNQKTIIGGDNSEPVISLAAIAAKVQRDRLMVRLSKKHPAYGFEQHKGYGTRAHYTAIKNHGSIPFVHRATYCTKM